MEGPTRSRRKNMKRVEAALSLIEEDEEGEKFDGCGGPTSRCSVKLIHSVISAFNSEKQRIAASTGFGGLLKFPAICKLNLKLSVWLLLHLDVEKRAIVVDEKKIYQFDKSDVEKIFGIPSKGISVSDRRLDRTELAINEIRTRIGMANKDGRSLKAAQAILEKEYNEPMTPEQVDAFKTAFVMFFMGHLFAPTTKHDYISLNFWPALLDPNNIANFNWAEYVIEELFIASVKLKTDMKRRNSVANITGCTLFLQLFYLDSIDLGDISLPHDVLPRISAFTNDNIKTMILADSSRNISGRGEIDFGISQPRDPTKSIYSKVTYPEKGFACTGISSLNETSTGTQPTNVEEALNGLIDTHVATIRRVILSDLSMGWCSGGRDIASDSWIGTGEGVQRKMTIVSRVSMDVTLQSFDHQRRVVSQR